MKRIISIVSVSISILLIVIASCPVASASNPQEFYLPMSKPSVSENSGYVEVFWSDGVGNKYVDVYSWVFTPLMNSSVQEFLPTTNQLLVSTVYSNNQVSLSFAANDSVEGYFALTYISSNGDYHISCRPMNATDEPFTATLSDSSGHTVHGFHYYGNVQTTNGAPSVMEEFTVMYGSESVIASELGNIISTLNVLFYLCETEFPEFENYLSSMVTSLNSFSGSFDQFKELFQSKMTLLLSYCEDYFQLLKKIDITNSSILSEIMYIEELLYTMSDTLWEIYLFNTMMYNELYGIRQDIGQILLILQQQTDTEFTTVDQSGFDNYYDVENGLLDNSNVNVDDVLKVEVNQNALTVIWDFVERGLNSHGKIFGMVLTILALGIIALILGR